MLSKEYAAEARQRVVDMYKKAGIVVLPKEIEELELADFGLNDYEVIGLGVLVYINTNRVCAKEMVLLPGQTCPEHIHPTHDGIPGKEETFRCRYGTVYVYVDGEKNCDPDFTGMDKYKEHLTMRHEIVLHPGEEFTLVPDSWHWFRSGPEGAVISEFSTHSTDEDDIFRDPAIARITVVDK